MTRRAVRRMLKDLRCVGRLWTRNSEQLLHFVQQIIRETRLLVQSDGRWSIRSMHEASRVPLIAREDGWISIVQT